MRGLHRAVPTEAWYVHKSCPERIFRFVGNVEPLEKFPFLVPGPESNFLWFDFVFAQPVVRELEWKYVAFRADICYRGRRPH